ncbi:MAG: IS110 family transposase [Myxococcota bacterium]|nr:IS110 family transposase [Myxococcota bacterium]
MQYCGLDLGKKSSHFCIVDKNRKVKKQGQVRNRLADITRCFRQLPPMRIALEASTKSFWLADRLEEMGHAVIVVDPGQTKAIGAAGIKHDKLDAKVLADLCAANLLARVDRPTEKQRLERMIVVTRDGLVKSRTRLVNMVRSILDSEGFELNRCATDAFVDQVSRAWFDLPEAMCNAIEPVITTIHMLCEQIDDCDARLKETMVNDPSVKLLMSTPGVGVVVASCFLMAIRDPNRFKTGRQAGAYLGLVPALYQSGKTFRRGRITKHGNRQARWALCVAANALLRARKATALSEWGRGLVVRLGRKKAIVAIARKLASVMWAMLKNNTPFEPRLSKAA